jgi:hypothetical protein
LLYLTTGKIGWILLLPVAIAFAGPRALLFFDSHRWLRRLLHRDLYPYHALLFAEAFSWLLYRYLVTGRRIAHYPTLLLEGVFIVVFLALFWAVALYTARVAQFTFGGDDAEVFRRVTTAATPLIALPLVPIFWIPTTRPAAMLILALLVVAALALRLRRPLSARAWRGRLPPTSSSRCLCTSSATHRPPTSRSGWTCFIAENQSGRHPTTFTEKFRIATSSCCTACSTTACLTRG